MSAVAQPRSVRPAGARHRRRPQQERGRGPRRSIDEGPFLPEEALRARPGRRSGVRGPARRPRAGASAARASCTLLESDDYARRQLGVARRAPAQRASPSSTPSAPSRSGSSGYDPVNGPVVGSDTLVEYIRRIRADRSIRAIVAAHRQPGRLVHGVRRHLARADDHQERPAQAPARRVDVRPGGVGRLLHRHGRRRDRRAAGDADRLDRHLRRQVRHRRHVRQARRQHRGDQRRPARRDLLARPPLHRRGAGQDAANRCRRSTTSSSRRSPRRDSTSPEKIDPIAQGRVWTGQQASQVGSGRSARRPQTRHRASPSSAPASPPTRKSSWWSIRRAAASTRCSASSSSSRRRPQRPPKRSLTLLGPRDRRVLGALLAPSRLFRSGEILAHMPYVFLR